MGTTTEAKSFQEQQQKQSQAQQPSQPQRQAQQPVAQGQRGAQRQQSVDERFTTPPANIYATDNDYVVEIEMPGVDKSGLEVRVDGNELVITGRRAKDLPDGELAYCESALANYRRAFELGPDVDTGKIEAKLTQGVLKLRLPKSERAKPQRIQVQG
jgi:HSP20 family protein